jgi:hypothetical protein
MNKNIFALVFLMAGTLLSVGAITTMVPAAYAGGDDHDDDNGDHDRGDNKNKAEDDSAAAIADCDDNDVEEAGFDCFGIAVNGLDVDLEEGMTLGFVDGIPSVYPRD